MTDPSRAAGAAGGAVDSAEVPFGASSTNTYPGMPGWLKVSAIVVLVVVLVFVGMHLAGGGMGSINHMPAGAH